MGSDKKLEFNHKDVHPQMLVLLCFPQYHVTITRAASKLLCLRGLTFDNFATTDSCFVSQTCHRKWGNFYFLRFLVLCVKHTLGWLTHQISWLTNTHPWSKGSLCDQIGFLGGTSSPSSQRVNNWVSPSHDHTFDSCTFMFMFDVTAHGPWLLGHFLCVSVKAVARCFPWRGR